MDVHGNFVLQSIRCTQRSKQILQQDVSGETSRMHQGEIFMTCQPRRLHFWLTHKGGVLTDMLLRGAHFGDQEAAYIDGCHWAAG